MTAIFFLRLMHVSDVVCTPALFSYCGNLDRDAAVARRMFVSGLCVSLNEMESLVRVLVESSEKAAELARVVRRQGSFCDLVEEKGEREKNPKFKHDFKTLADVLVQETIKREISVKVHCHLILIQLHHR